MDVSRETDDLHRLEERAPAYRYGAVLVLMLAVVVFVIVAPSGSGSRAVALALEGLALLVAVVGAAAGVFPAAIDLALSAGLALAIPAALVGGLLRLIREHGVTVQAVAGALAIYLLIGLVFASAISFIAHVDSTPYYAQGTSGSEGDRVYYSFTVLTTTGFGDLTAGTRLGRALAVLEMLVGQLYLVTVIGLLIGSFAGRRRA